MSPGCYGPDESFKIRGGDHFSIDAKGIPNDPRAWELVDVYFATTAPKGVLPSCIDVHHSCS